MRGGGDAEWAKVLGLVREKELCRGNAGGWADLLGRSGLVHRFGFGFLFYFFSLLIYF